MLKSLYKIYSVVRTIALFLFVGSTMSVNAQCGLEQLPYKTRFDTSTQNACWLTSTGTNPAIFYFNGALLNASAQAGPCILVSPSFYVDEPAKLNYSFHHQLNGTWGLNDSITVQIRKLPGNWVTLKAYPMGFNTLNHNVSSIWPLSEEFDLDQSYVGDTIRVRFIF